MKAIGGLKEAIERSITFKFPGNIDTVMAEVNKIDDHVFIEELADIMARIMQTNRILQV